MDVKAQSFCEWKLNDIFKNKSFSKTTLKRSFSSWGSAWGEDGYMRVKRTPGQDPCKLYSYWSQATAIGSNETYVPPKAGGGEYVVPKTSSEGSTASSENGLDDCGEIPCEEQCGCDYDDDDDDEDDDYEEDDEEHSAEEEEEEVLELRDSQ